VVIEDFTQFGGEPLAVEQIRDPQRAPRNLVLVRRTDPAACGADGVRAL